MTKASNFFNDKVFIVTGASSGLGFELSNRIAKCGAHVIMFARNQKKLKEAEEKIISNAKHLPFVLVGDVTKESQVQHCISEAIKKYGRLDGMILNAGKSMWKKFFTLKSPQELKEIMDINYWGVVHFCYYGIPYVKKNNGKVVIISSLQSIIGVPYHTGYAASKHALNGFIESIVLEENINILNVIVSWIRGTSLRKNSLGIEDRKESRSHKENNKNNIFSIQVEDCAEKIIATMSTKKKVIYLPRIVTLFPLVKFFFPHWFAKKIKATVTKEI